MKVEIKSSLPGIFYRSPAPESPFFKNEGDMVAAGDTIGLIEVMKTFTEIKSEVTGKLLKYHAESEEFIDIGQTIAEIEAS